MHVLGSKFGGKFYKFCGKYFLKIKLHRVHGVHFFLVCNGDIPLTSLKKASMKNLTIPLFKQPIPDQNKIQETEFICDQCCFKCNSELVLKHQAAKKLMKPSINPPPYSDIDPKKKNSERTYCDLKFVGNHAYGKHHIEDHKFFYQCGHCQTQLQHSTNIYNIHFNTYHPGVQYEKPKCWTALLKPLPSITKIH